MFFALQDVLVKIPRIGIQKYVQTKTLLYGTPSKHPANQGENQPKSLVEPVHLPSQDSWHLLPKTRFRWTQTKRGAYFFYLSFLLPSHKGGLPLGWERRDMSRNFGWKHLRTSSLNPGAEYQRLSPLLFFALQDVLVKIPRIGIQKYVQTKTLLYGTPSKHPANQGENQPKSLVEPVHLPSQDSWHLLPKTRFRWTQTKRGAYFFYLSFLLHVPLTCVSWT